MLKESLLKAKHELVSVRKTTSLANSKIDFARKVTEQRMTESLSDPTWTPEKEDDLALISLYSTLIDEDNFSLENDTISPHDGFLKEVEEKLVARGENPSEMLHFSHVKNKILEKVKVQKSNRKSSKKRRDSICSLSSIGILGLKRGSSELAGGDISRPKTDSTSPTPNLI